MRVIVGSSDLWLTPDVTGAIVAIIAASEPGEELAIRVAAGEDEPPSPVERFVDAIGPRMGHPVKRCQPSTGNGRSATFRRDFEMVETSSHVYAFFSPEREMDGGTGHVVKAALDRGIPVEAYGIGEQGQLILLGSDEGIQEAEITSRPEVLERMWQEGR